jgi:hypothetical protein
MTHNREDDPVHTLDDLVARTHAWNARKQRFTPRQISIAAKTLAARGWVAPVADKRSA